MNLNPPRFGGTLLVKASPYTNMPSGNNLKTELFYRQFAYAGEIGGTELGNKGVLLLFPKDKNGESGAYKEVVSLVDSIGATHTYFPEDKEALTDEKIKRFQAMV
ncbi:MAG: hypothetical protein K2X66_10165 [Cyanobacteria bacterium]|nr:hypothetical protein [Cyanobacteriota bacterium]